MADLPDLPKTETAIIEQTNAFRQSQGLSPVSRNPVLAAVAREFARYLAKSGRFAHEADGRQPAERTKDANYAHCTVAENLASNQNSNGFTTTALATDVVDGWKGSAGHRRNMLLANVTDIGVGVAMAPGTTSKYLSVQILGRPLSFRYEFRIENNSRHSVHYHLAGKDHDAEPGVTITHKACEPVPLEFVRYGTWMARSPIGKSFEPVDKARFVLRDNAAGGVEIESAK